MTNPWLNLPESAPYVAPDDAEMLERLSLRLRGPFAMQLDLLPQPWTGDIKRAEILMLALNPGYAEADREELRNHDYADQWKAALSFCTRTPFYFLDPAFKATGGARWWARRLRDLISIVGHDVVAQKVMCVEHFPYKSARYAPLGATLPSQRYSFDLVRDAISRGKQIVVMRSERIWLESVAELRSYPYVRLTNHQNPHLSRAQMTADQFDALCKALL